MVSFPWEFFQGYLLKNRIGLAYTFDNYLNNLTFNMQKPVDSSSIIIICIVIIEIELTQNNFLSLCILKMTRVTNLFLFVINYTYVYNKVME